MNVPSDLLCVRRPRAAWVVCCGLAVTATLGWSAEDAERPHPQSRPDHLRLIWDGQRSKISSVFIRFRSMTIGRHSLPEPLGADELHRLLSSVDLVKDPNNLRQFAKLLKKREIRDPAWETATLCLERNKKRYEQDCGTTWIDVHVMDGKNDAYLDGQSGQVYVYRAGGSPRAVPGITDLRALPPQDVGIDEYTIVVLNDGNLKMTRGHLELTVAPGTGAVERIANVGDDGKPGREILQQGFVTYPGDVLFPTVVLTIEYSSIGAVRLIEVTAVEEAVFNQPLPQATFKIQIPRPTILWDHRDNPVAPRPITIVPTEDAVKEVLQPCG